MPEPPEPVASPSPILRPHHIALAAFINIIFRPPPPSTAKAWSLSAHLHALRLLLDEVVELSQPRHITQLITDIRGNEPPDSDHNLLADTLADYPEQLRAPGEVAALLDDVYNLIVPESDEIANAPIDRRSILGLFVRRTHICFAKFSFSAVIKLQNDFWEWCQDPKSTAGYVDTMSEQDRRRTLLFPTPGDYQEQTRTEPLADFEKAASIGDTSAAIEKLHQFFDQHFTEGISEHGLLQHALLKLARFHFVAGQLDAARKVLEEAISVARTNGDKLVLEHCISLSRRFPNPSELQAAIEPSPYSSTTALDCLWEIYDLIDTNQPLSICFEKLYEAVGAYDLSSTYHHRDDQQPLQPDQMRERDRPPPHHVSSAEEQFAQHAVQSILWTYGGCERLAEIEENIVIAFSDRGSDDDVCFNMKRSKARRAVRQGDIEGGLSILFEPDTWQHLTVKQYHQWSEEVWQALVTNATRRGQTQVYRSQLQPLLGRKEETPPPKESKYFNQMQWAKWYQRANEPTPSLHVLLSALWDSEFAGHFRYYRIAVVLLADLGLELGTEDKSLQWLQDIMPQVMNGDDRELRAYACWTFARSKVSIGKGKESSLQAALPYLDLAEKDYSQLCIPDALALVQGFLAMVYDRLGMKVERDQAAARHNTTVSDGDRWRRKESSEEVGRILEDVVNVGAAILRRDNSRG